MIRALVCLAAVSFVFFSQAAPARAGAVVGRPIDALGGETALKSIAALQLDAIGHEYFIDQSERPEGPFVIRYLQTTEKRDAAGGGAGRGGPPGRPRLGARRLCAGPPGCAPRGGPRSAAPEPGPGRRGTRAGPAGRQ